MKTLILAGGLGTRLAEETHLRPKPMVEVGGKPMLWHIMNLYSHHGFREFIVALGYKSEVIKEYFLNFRAMNADLSLDLAAGTVKTRNDRHPDWKVDLVETGLNTATGGRMAKIRAWLGDDDTFMMTYGDGVADVDLKDLVRFHKAHGRLATVTAVRPPARFGGIRLEGDQVLEFEEKPQAGEGWINGGFFVLSARVLDEALGDDVSFEYGPLRLLAEKEQLMAYRHEGFWQAMDTLRDHKHLERLWETGQAPWKVWR